MFMLPLLPFYLSSLLCSQSSVSLSSSLCEARKPNPKSRHMGRVPCCDKNGLKKGPWTPEEDQKLIDYIQKNGHGTWRTLPKNAGLARCGKSCRLRWANYLRPDIKRGRFSFEEEETIIQLHSVLGNKWSAIAARLPGRTDNEIKNYWNTHIRKRLLRSGIDPVTHRPRLDLLNLSSLLNTLLFNHHARLDAAKLPDIKPQLNAKFLRIVASLLQSQQQKQNLLKPNHGTTTQQLNPPSLPCNPVLFNLSENLATANNNLSYENMAQSVSGLLYEASNARSSGDRNLYGNIDSMLSTSVSSVTLNNSSTIVNGNTEEEKDTYCSNFFDFQIPELSDMNEFA